MRVSEGGRPFVRRLAIACALLIVAVTAAIASAAVTESVPGNTAFPSFEVRSLDGSGNNQAHPQWGAVGSEYTRVGRAHYADGVSAQVNGVNARFVSNRIFNDVGQNLFSEREVSQWGWLWGQFMDHVFGLAQGGTEQANIPFNQNDPLEGFRNSFGSISFTREAAAPGSGTSIFNPREAVNTVSSYIDAWNVYGGTNARLEWMREGPVDGNMANNGPKLLLAPGGYLPRATARGNASTAPEMATDGQLAGHPQDRAVAGDRRANENMALTSVHTLFAREHNRIVGLLPSTLTSEQKFQIARRVVGAEMQFITYTEFLPAMGVTLQPYKGYNPNVDATLSTEFATVGYRAHSQIHGEFEPTVSKTKYSATQLAQLQALGVRIEDNGDGTITLVIPLNAAFFQPDLVNALGLDTVFGGLAESQYKNDEQIDNTLRSLLFQVPGPNTTDPQLCFQDPITAEQAGCFQGVVDLGAIDVQRGRDHGVGTYNDVRDAYGLPKAFLFENITEEPIGSGALPSGTTINSPQILDFVKLFDINGNQLTMPNSDDAVVGVRRSTLTARLKAVYGDPDKVDAFVGAYSEKHLSGSEMGPLNHRIWRVQFEALRDGDRFFYLNDPVLTDIQNKFGITFKHTLAEIIRLNVPGAQVADNVFFAD
jgi:peroxidase